MSCVTKELAEHAASIETATSESWLLRSEVSRLEVAMSCMAEQHKAAIAATMNDAAALRLEVSQLKALNEPMDKVHAEVGRKTEQSRLASSEDVTGNGSRTLLERKDHEIRKKDQEIKGLKNQLREEVAEERSRRMESCLMETKQRRERVDPVHSWMELSGMFEDIIREATSEIQASPGKI